jgi:hypothetical protein
MGSILKWNEFLKFIENEIKYGNRFRSHEFRNSDENEKLIEKRTNKTTYLRFSPQICTYVYNDWLSCLFDNCEMAN